METKPDPLDPVTYWEQRCNLTEKAFCAVLQVLIAHANQHQAQQLYEVMTGFDAAVGELSEMHIDALRQEG